MSEDTGSALMDGKEPRLMSRVFGLESFLRALADNLKQLQIKCRLTS